jgi:hypothetical protein
MRSTSMHDSIADESSRDRIKPAIREFRQKVPPLAKIGNNRSEAVLVFRDRGLCCKTFAAKGQKSIQQLC